MRHIRILFIAVVAVALLACDDGLTPQPDPVDEPEVGRGDFHLLVEKFSLVGERSWYAMTPAGTFHAPVAAPGDAVELIPAPDGRRIAYVRLYDDLLHLWIMDRDGAGRRAVLEGELLVEHVSWSPDGTRLVLQISTLDDEDDIALINADGSGFRRLTQDGANFAVFDQHPEWSPDGSRILFMSSRAGNMRLHTMNPDGGDVREIAVAMEGLMRGPRWSRDGAHIAFEALTPAGRGVGVVRADGTSYTFWPVAGDVGRVTWLPDGRVAYSTNRDVNYEIYARDITTGAETNITRHTDHDYRVRVLKNATLTPWLGLRAPVTYESGAQNPSGIAAGDVTGDGLADIVVSSPGSAELRLLRGTATGFAPFGGLTATAAVRDVHVADVTGDREPDIIALGASGFSVWKGGGGGPFASTFHGLEGEAHSLAIGDIDRDGTANVTMTFIEGATPGGPPLPFNVGIWGHNADGRVIALVNARTQFFGPRRIVIGDVTAEGNPDVLALAAAGGANTAVLLMQGQGPGGFSAIAPAAQLSGQDARDVPVTADFDGDRRADLAVLRPGASLTVFLAVGDQLGGASGIDVKADDVAAADLDRDGDVDLVAVSRADRSLWFLRNLGDGTFASPKRTALALEPARLTVADLDRDLWPDVVLVTPGGRVQVLTNRGR